MHDGLFAIGDSDQVTDFHLTEAQRNISEFNVPADLNDTGSLPNPAVTDDTGSEVGFSEDLLQYDFHLFDVHNSPDL